MKVNLNLTRAESPQRRITAPIEESARSEPTTIAASEFNKPHKLISVAVAEAEDVSQWSQERVKSTKERKKNDIEYARAQRERNILLESKQQIKHDAINGSDDGAAILPSDEKRYYTPSFTFTDGRLHESRENVLSRKSLRYHNRLCPIIVLADRPPGVSIQTTGVAAISKPLRTNQSLGYPVKPRESKSTHKYPDSPTLPYRDDNVMSRQSVPRPTSVVCDSRMRAPPLTDPLAGGGTSRTLWMLADLEARLEERLSISERRTVWLEATLFRLLHPNYSSGQPSFVNGDRGCLFGEDELYVEQSLS